MSDSTTIKIIDNIEQRLELVEKILASFMEVNIEYIARLEGLHSLVLTEENLEQYEKTRTEVTKELLKALSQEYERAGSETSTTLESLDEEV